MKKGNIPKGAVEYIFGLINEAKALNREKKHLANESFYLDLEENVEGV